MAFSDIEMKIPDIYLRDGKFYISRLVLVIIKVSK